MPLENCIPNSPYLTGATFRDGWVRREKCICRLLIEQVDGHEGGTGVLVGPDLVLTCFHVLKDAIPREGYQPTVSPGQIVAQFDFLHESQPSPSNSGDKIGLAEDWLVHFRPYSMVDPGDDGGLPKDFELDFALVRLKKAVGKKRGWLSLTDRRETNGQELPADKFLTILQHRCDRKPKYQINAS